MCTGGGSNLQALLDAEAQGNLSASIVLVISNRRKAYALERARAAGRETQILRPRDYKAEAEYSKDLLSLLNDRGIELICLAGYLKRLPSVVVARYRGRILNIHPGPLPQFGGAGMYGHHVHEAVIESGVKETGPTVFFVEEDYDTGPVVAFSPVPVLDGDSPDSLARRVLAAEHKLYPKVVAAVASGRIQWQNGALTGRLDE